jgi:Serine dehydrogenase proteinase
MNDLTTHNSFAEQRKLINQPPLLFDETQTCIARIQELIGLPVVVYWGSERGSLCDNDTVALFDLLRRQKPLKEVALFLKSPGGVVESSLKFVHVLRRYAKRVVALVPAQCASAATIVALGADKIVMGPIGYLTPIDSSQRHQLSPIDQINNSRVSVSSDEIARLVRLWQSNAKEHHENPYSDLFKYVHPLVIGSIDRSMSLSVKVCTEVLTYHMSDIKRAEEISRRLNADYPSHSYPITSREAKKIGLPVEEASAQLTDVMLALNVMYSETAQRSITDFDPQNYHDNEILNIIEMTGAKTYWQNERDFNYITNERRWQTLNDKSSWRKIGLVKGKQVIQDLHIR